MGGGLYKPHPKYNSNQLSPAPPPPLPGPPSSSPRYRPPTPPQSLIQNPLGIQTNNKESQFHQPVPTTTIGGIAVSSNNNVPNLVSSNAAAAVAAAAAAAAQQAAVNQNNSTIINCNIQNVTD